MFARDTSSFHSALIVAFGALVGCDRDQESNPGAASAPATAAQVSESAKATITDSCQLLTRAEAAAAAGNAVREGKHVGPVCIFEQEDLNVNSNLQVSVAFVPFPPGADAKQLCAAGLAGIPNSKPFAGIGDRAYWEFQQGGLSNNGSLHVCVKQGTVDTAAIGGRPEADLQRIAVSLAKTALGRL
jgi:hypothetical protein